ncbi:MAG: hydrogen peroxide-inducible genes activator [Saprospiraceae bacterium]|nr:hydrogen peroxide-inducible genes activator [Saprospiraceae bacterium]
MNIQQLEYIAAVDNLRHFAKAAEGCHVTQPTLSMMIQKLEEELDCKIFDRSRQPVVPTDIGETVIRQARKILNEVGRLHELVKERQAALNGKLCVGIIPTLAPYLVPYFLESFVLKYPSVEFTVTEHLTQTLLEKLKTGAVDAAVMAGPLPDKSLEGQSLFFEAFFVYTSDTAQKEGLMADELNAEDLWLLQEGHCLRTSIRQLCDQERDCGKQFRYEAGSLETLKRLVEMKLGYTILPELAAMTLPKDHRFMLRSFASPAPAREIMLVTQPDYIKKRLIQALKDEILACLPASILEERALKVV